MINPNRLDIARAFTQWQTGDWQRVGRVWSKWADEVARDPLMRRVVMVIELVLGGIAGRTVRIATVPLTSTDSEGLRHDVLPLLLEEPELHQSYTLGTGSGEVRSLQLTMSIQRQDMLALIRAGHILAGVAEVALEVQGAATNEYVRRYPVIRGDIGGVTFGALRTGRKPDAETVTVEIVDPRDSVAVIVPPWVLDVDRHAGLHTSATGERYAIVVNQAHRAPTQRITSFAVGTNSFAVCVRSGYTVSTVGTSQVFVNGVGYGTADAVYAWVFEDATDDLGTAYQRVRFTVGATVWADTDAVHVTVSQFDDDLKSYSPVGVLRHVLEEYSPVGMQGVNDELFATAEARYPISSGQPRCCINSSSGGGTVLDWIEGGFLVSFPMISMVWEQGRYGPVLTDNRLPALAEWVVGQTPLLDRLSMVQESSKGELFNNFTLRYGYNPIDDTYTGVATRNPTNSALCAHSQAMIGQRDYPEITSLYIEDAATAAYVLDWLVEHFALPSYLIEYEAMPSIFLLYRRGDPVRLTDDDFGYDRERATIQSMSYARGRSVVLLRVWLRYLDLGGAALSVPVAV